MKPKKKAKNKFLGMTWISKIELKTNNFCHLITKAKFHTRYFPVDKQICNQVVSTFFSTPRTLLHFGIIRTDILKINLFTISM